MAKTYLIDENDIGNKVINKDVDNLTNYYDKNEVDGLIPVFDNKENLDKIGEDAEGHFTYNGESISGKVTSVNGQEGDVTINVPTSLSELTDDETHRLVTDAEKEKWDASGGASSADEVSFDGSPSSLSATNVQDAIDEVLSENKVNYSLDSSGTGLNIDGGFSSSNITVEIVDIGNDKYFKYSDGTLVYYSYIYFQSINITKAWGSFYESEELEMGTFHIPFKTIHSCHVTTSSSAAFMERIADYNTTSKGKVILSRPTTAYNFPVTINMTFVGTWK